MEKKSKEEQAAARAERRAKQAEVEKQEKIQFERELKHLNELKLNYIEKRRLSVLIASDLDGIYDEIDKLTKKSPADLVTDLQLEIVNDLIDMAKTLIKHDELISKVNKFVPAGDNPAYRDVIIILRRLKQGLFRFNNNFDTEARSILKIAEDLIPDYDFDSVKDIELKEIYKREEFYEPSIYDSFK